MVPWTAHTQQVPTMEPTRHDDAYILAMLVKQFGTTLPHVFLRLKDEETFVQSQLVHERLTDIAIDLYASAYVLSRLDTEGDNAAGRYFLKFAFRRIRDRFAGLEHNDDAACLDAAKAALGRGL